MNHIPSQIGVYEIETNAISNFSQITSNTTTSQRLRNERQTIATFSRDRHQRSAIESRNVIDEKKGNKKQNLYINLFASASDQLLSTRQYREHIFILMCLFLQIYGSCTLHAL